jgi:hypothetical protein
LSDFIGKRHKRVSEYIAEVWTAEEEKPSVSGDDRGSEVNVCE